PTPADPHRPDRHGGPDLALTGRVRHAWYDMSTIDPSPDPADPPRLFTAERRPLDRLARVRPGTVVIIFDGQRPPRVRVPGEVLIPSWWPFLPSIEVLPVTTDTIEA